MSVEVATVDITDVVLVQKGFLLAMTAAHPGVELSVAHSSETEQNTLTMEEGENQFCLRKAGEYTLKPKSCHKFAKSKYTYNTAKPKDLHFEATHYKVGQDACVAGCAAPEHSLLVKGRWLCKCRQG